MKLDELQLKIMKVLWAKGTASVGEIKKILEAERSFAITTISTVLQRLYKKGVVDYHKEGRQYIYKAIITEKETQTSMTSNLLNQLFGGKSSVLVNHLLEADAIESEELEQLKLLIEKAQNKKKEEGNEQ